MRFRSLLCVFVASALSGPPILLAQQPEPAPAPAATEAPAAPVAPAAPPPQVGTDGKVVVAPLPPKGKKSSAKDPYTGPNTIVQLAPTPILDVEGKQMLDPDGKPMFNPPVKQMRDKKGHPEFDAAKKPVFQTATNLGYDERGKKIPLVKVKPPKMVPASISRGTLTVDGWTGKAALNYEIKDFRFMYIYAPGIGTTIVSLNPFPGAKEQPKAFNLKTLDITVEGHPIEVASDKPMLGKKPISAWVAVDRGFLLPAKFPVFGYGTTSRAPYAWPGSKENVALLGPAAAPPLPTDLRPTLLLAPCPAGMMRRVAAPVLPGQKAPDQPCVPIKAAVDGPPSTVKSN